jgi:glycerophosphoryl diester phosphodiesterase
LAQEPSRPRDLVAHRGASAYAPEHTKAAYELAIAQGADYVEQDLAVTKDGALICLHDDSLERTTDVEEVFPDRFVTDGAGTKRWMAGDFTLAEIKRLDAGRWFDRKFAGERIPTWGEAVAVAAGRAGLYPELKSPALHARRGVDMIALVVEALRQQRLDRPAGTAVRPPIILQSFDPEALKALAAALPNVPRVFLMEPRAAEAWLGANRFAEIRTFATGIGPAKAILEARPEVVRAAHAAGLTVTPYTFRSSNTGSFPDVATEMRHFIFDLGVDAVFTDNPDKFPRH